MQRLRPKLNLIVGSRREIRLIISNGRRPLPGETKRPKRQAKQIGAPVGCVQSATAQRVE